MAVQRFGGFIFIPPITKQTRREGAAKINKLYNKISTNCTIRYPQIVQQNALKLYNGFATNCIVGGVDYWGCGG